MADVHMVEMAIDPTILKHIINRRIDQHHVDKLAAGFTHRFALNSCPVIVSKDYYIIDGQHRIAAAKKRGFPVFYIRDMRFDKSNVMDEIIKRNTVQKKWSISDQMSVFSQNDKHSDYRFLEDLLNEFKSYINFSALFEICDFAIDKVTEEKFKSKQSLFKSGNIKLKNMHQINSFVREYVTSCEKHKICHKAVDRCQTLTYFNGLFELYLKKPEKNSKRTFKNFMQRLNGYWEVLVSTRNRQLAKDKIDYMCAC